MLNNKIVTLCAMSGMLSSLLKSLFTFGQPITNVAIERTKTNNVEKTGGLACVMCLIALLFGTTPCIHLKKRRKVLENTQV